MIVTDRLLFLHLHKSGGTFVNALLKRCVPTARQIGYHLPYREAPEACRDLPVVGTVRNPWAYYVSWYHFQLSVPKRNILFQICSDEGQLGFKQTVANLVDLASDEPRLALLEAGLPDAYGKAGINLTKACVGELRERAVGFYSFLYERLYAGADAPTILRVERLREELRAVFVAVGHLPNTCAEQFLDESPPLNVSRHDAPSRYFDEGLAALVAQRDARLIERYGYVLE
jgi:hypothetical protein